MFVVATTRRNASPSLILELLLRVARVVKDYCGVLTEDALRKNAILVYELLDEMLDHGYAQSTNTDSLKNRVHNEPAPLPEKEKARFVASSPASARRSSRNDGTKISNPLAVTVFAGMSAAMSLPGSSAMSLPGSSAVRVTGMGTADARIAADATARSVIASSKNDERDRDEIFVDVVTCICCPLSSVTSPSFQPID